MIKEADACPAPLRPHLAEPKAVLLRERPDQLRVGGRQVVLLGGVRDQIVETRRRLRPLGRGVELAVELSLSGEEADALHEGIVQIKT